MTKTVGSGSASGPISQRHGSADPDSHQNVMDPQHWELQYGLSKEAQNPDEFEYYFCVEDEYRF